MALKETVKHMEQLIAHITKDLVKASKGNKAAAQRVRTGTIKLEKTAKTYRRESIAECKKGANKKKAAKAAKTARSVSKKRHTKKAHSRAKAKRR